MALHRRKLLQAATALTAGLAGCGGFTGSTTRSETIAAGGRSPPANSETDPPQLVARAGTEQPPIRLVDPDAEPSEDGESDHLGHRIAHSVIDSREQAARLTVADGVEPDGDLASFVEETAFDDETLYLETNTVRECFRLELCWVSWGPERLRTEYARTLRAYDEACSVGVRVFESRFVRLPVALDSDDVSSFGTSIGSGHCEHGGGE